MSVEGLKTDPGMQVHLNLNLNALPACKCGKGQMLPIQDMTQGAVPLPYLKGWACPVCNHNIFFMSGKLVSLDVVKWEYKI